MDVAGRDVNHRELFALCSLLGEKKQPSWNRSLIDRQTIGALGAYTTHIRLLKFTKHFELESKTL